MVVGPAACATVLGIEDRFAEPTEAGATDGSVTDGRLTDASAETAADVKSVIDAAPEADAPPPKVCNADCTTFGGTCDGQQRCVKTCAAEACKATELMCPPEHDCVLNCSSTGECNDTSCIGGRSCTINCATAHCKDTHCGSPSCTFICTGTDSCATDNSKPVSCDGSDCRFECATAACKVGYCCKATSCDASAPASTNTCP